MAGAAYARLVSGPLVLAVPVCKAERFLPATLASLNAEGDRLRWWLQDAASTDRTAEIARQFARPGDTVVSEADRGQTDALNRAFPKMGGEIIGFINGDDLLAPGTAARVLAYFAAHPEIDLVYGAVEWIDEHGTVTGTHAGRLDSLEDVLDIYGVWWNRRQWVQPEVFFRRTLWQKVGGFDPQYHLAFDYDFWVRCFLAGARVARLPEVCAKFRIHAAQKSAAAQQAAEEIRRIVAHHLPSARLAPRKLRPLQARLSYDHYQSAATRQGFLRSLLGHPEWLRVPEARARLRAACLRLLPGAKTSA